MKFPFVCPVKELGFTTDDFSIVENRGVAEDGEGNRFLDAKVRIDSPCPHCGGSHLFSAAELACPFEPAGGD